jgi:hypothetical protein
MAVIFPGAEPFYQQAQAELGVQVPDREVYRLVPFRTLSSAVSQAVTAAAAGSLSGPGILAHCQAHLDVLRVAVRTCELMLQFAETALPPVAPPPPAATPSQADKPPSRKAEDKATSRIPVSS